MIWPLINDEGSLHATCKELSRRAKAILQNLNAPKWDPTPFTNAPKHNCYDFARNNTERPRPIPKSMHSLTPSGFANLVFYTAALMDGAKEEGFRPLHDAPEQCSQDETLIALFFHDRAKRSSFSHDFHWAALRSHNGKNYWAHKQGDLNAELVKNNRDIYQIVHNSNYTDFGGFWAYKHS